MVIDGSSVAHSSTINGQVWIFCGLRPHLLRVRPASGEDRRVSSRGGGAVLNNSRVDGQPSTHPWTHFIRRAATVVAAVLAVAGPTSACTAIAAGQPARADRAFERPSATQGSGEAPERGRWHPVDARRGQREPMFGASSGMYQRSRGRLRSRASRRWDPLRHL